MVTRVRHCRIPYVDSRNRAAKLGPVAAGPHASCGMCFRQPSGVPRWARDICASQGGDMVGKLRPPGLIGELAAEFAGTMILILIGVGVVAQVVAGGLGNHDSIAWAWGLAVILGVYTAGRISGAHLNPAVTLALAVFGGFSWRKVIPYSLAQTLGAFVAALLVRWNYSEVLAKVDPHHTRATQ